MPLNAKMQLWKKMLMEYKRKHGVSLKQAMQSETLKAAYHRRKKALGHNNTSPKRSSRRRYSPRKMSSPKRKSPKRKSPKRRTTSPRRRRR